MTNIDKATSGPVVSIDYTVNKGLQLNWNTKGMLHPNRNNTIRHLVILEKSDFQTSVSFISTYYSKMKLGDLIGILKPSKERENGYKVIWHQKSNVITDIKPYIKQKYLISGDIVKILEKVVKSFQKQTQLMFITIFPTLQVKPIKQYIQGIRYQGVDNIIFNLFQRSNYYEHFADLIDGIYYWYYYDSEDILRVCNSIKLLTNLITLTRITIKIQSLNGSLLSQNTCNWKNIDFSTIQKVYYGVFSFDCVETMFFVTQQSQYNFSLELILYLNYRLINGKEITCKKKITLKNDNSKVYQRTYAMEQETLKQFYLYKDLTVLSNYAKKQAIIWVSQVKQDDEQI